METAGRYQILDRLGTGAVGELYRAVDTQLGVTVALRIVDPRLAGDPATREELLADARAARQFSHPHAAALLDIVIAPREGAGQTRDAAGGIQLVHEFVEGRTLADLMRGRPLEPRLAFELAAQVAEALAAAVAAHFVHGALDPANVLVSPAGGAKVLELGLSRWTARRASRRDAARALETGGAAVPASSAWYLSPEEVLGSAGDERSDVFALGAILHEMLTGRPPFAADSAAAAVLKVMQAQPVPPSAANPALPPDVDAVILRALAKSFDNRYPDASDLAFELRALLATTPKSRPAAAGPLWPPAAARIEAAEEPSAEEFAPEESEAAETEEAEVRQAAEMEAEGAGAAEPGAVAVPGPAAAAVLEPGPPAAEPGPVELGELEAGSVPGGEAEERAALVPPPPAPYHGRRRRTRTLRAAIAAGILLAIAAAVWYVSTFGFPWQNRVRGRVAPRLMVLAFTVSGEGAPADYFALGFSEDLAARLSEIPGAIVLGRTSIRDATTTGDWRARARKLGATVVLRGSIRPGRYAWHADVELLDVASGASIWKQHFAREPRQAAALQADIAGQVAQRLGLAMPTSSRWTRSSSRTIDPAAYDLYLQGLDAAERRDRARAIGLYDQALERDPGLAEARAALSKALYLEEYYAGGIRDASASGRALREAETALAEDSELPAAHLAAALSAQTITTAASALSRALAFDPSNGEAWHHAGDLVSQLDPQASIPFYMASLTLEPAIDANWRDLASAYAAAGNWQEAERAVARGEAARPDRPWWKQVRARLEIERGRPEGAVGLLAGDPSVESAPIVWLMGRVVPLALAGRTGDARAEATRLVERYPSFCEGRAVLSAVEIDAGEAAAGRRLASSILAEASADEAEPAQKVCAALAAAGSGDSAQAADWLTRIAEDQRALRIWTRQAIFGVGLSFRSGWYPWNKVTGSRPVRTAASQLDQAIARLRDEVERRLPAPPIQPSAPAR